MGDEVGFMPRSGDINAYSYPGGLSMRIKGRFSVAILLFSLIGCNPAGRPSTQPAPAEPDPITSDPAPPPKEKPAKTESPKKEPKAEPAVLKSIKAFETKSNQYGHRLTLSPDGTKAVIMMEGTRLWDTATGKEIPWKDAETAKLMKTDWVGNTTYSADGALLWANSDEDRIVAIDAKTHKIVQTIASEHARGRILQLSPGGKYLATPTAVFDIASKKEKFEFGKERDLEEVLFSRDGKKLVTRGKKGICLWDLGSGKCVHTIPFKPDSSLSTQYLAASPTADLFALRTKKKDEQVLEIRDMKSGDVKSTLAGGLQLMHGNLAWSPDGNLLTVAVLGRDHLGVNSDPTLWLFDVKSGKPVATLPPTRTIDVVAFSGDGRRLGIIVLGKESADKHKLMLWDLTKLPK